MTRINRRMKQVLGLLATVFGLAPVLLIHAQDKSGVLQAGTEALTLPMAVELALRTNPLTRATASGREIAAAQLREARAGRFPQVQISETFTNSNNPVFVFGSLLEQGRFTQQNFDLQSLNNPEPLTNFRFSITMKAPVFDQQQTATRVTRAQLGERQADAQTSHIEQRIRFETLSAFYGLLLAQAKKEVSDEAVVLAESDIKLSRDRVDSGTSVVSDLLAAEVQLAEARQQQIQTDGDIITAAAALKTAMGVPVNAALKVDGQFVERAFDGAGQEELIQLALQHRPDLKRAALVVQSGETQLQGVHGERLPRVDVFANFGASRNDWVNGSSDYLAGASVTLTLLDRGRDARMAQARATVNLASSDQEQLANRIRFEVVRANQQYISARERVKVAERTIDHASEALRIVRDRYLEGLTTITEVLRTETTLTRARLNLLAARHDHYVGFANVMLSTGRLTDLQPFTR